jgi:hypothetical protein
MWQESFNDGRLIRWAALSFVQDNFAVGSRRQKTAISKKDLWNAYNRRRVEERYAAGLCTRCREKVVPGFKVCARHLEAQRNTANQYYLNHKNSGLCTDCERKAAPGSLVCERHLELRKEISKRTYRIRKEKGLCVACGKEAIPGATECEYHAELKKEASWERRQERKANGICTRCSKTAEPGLSTCKAHQTKVKHESAKYYREHSAKITAKTKARYEKLKSDRKCVMCGNPLAEEENIYCTVCRIRHREWNKERARRKARTGGRRTGEA